jgi:hypothetical protein
MMKEPGGPDRKVAAESMKEMDSLLSRFAALK